MGHHAREHKSIVAPGRLKCERSPVAVGASGAFGYEPRPELPFIRASSPFLYLLKQLSTAQKLI
jgi:hypothetical protein